MGNLLVFVKQKKSEDFLNFYILQISSGNPELIASHAKKLNSTFNLEIQFLLLRTIFYKNNQFFYILERKRQFQNEHGFV